MRTSGPSGRGDCAARVPARPDRVVTSSARPAHRTGALARAVCGVALALAICAAPRSAPAQAGDDGTYDPAATARIGATYAALHLDLARALAPPAGSVGPAAGDPRALRVPFSAAVDDATRARISTVLAGGDDARAAALQRTFAHEQFLDQSTQAVRGFGLRETDLADVVAALLIVAWNVTEPRATSAAQNAAIAAQMHAALGSNAAIGALAAGDKQTIATEMAYQIVLWQADAAAFAQRRDAGLDATLHRAIARSLASLGIDLAHARLGRAGFAFDHIAGSMER